MMRIIILFILFVAFSSAGLKSQNTLKGRVEDENNEPYQNILLVIEQTGDKTWTDKDGNYIFEDVPSGLFALSVDYKYDKQYYSVKISAADSIFNISLTRRIEFNEILIQSYQMDLSNYSNASTLNSDEINSLVTEKDLPYILKRVAGIITQSDAGNGVGYTGIRFRGLDPAHIQVNINGIPFNDSESSLSYFVDIPDILSVTETVTVLKGNVPNRAGTPSFGGAIDLNTNKLQFDPSMIISSQYGSYNTWKYSIVANSGLLDNKYSLEFGLSKQKSDGYIERSSSDLKSFRLSGSILHKNSVFRLNYIHGTETTGQAWFGLPVQFANIDSLRTFNQAGREKTGIPYDNEIDFYQQDHIQVFYQHQLNNKCSINSIANYTSGNGYFENYKGLQDLSAYAIHSDTLTADIIKREWLQNQFLFFHSNLMYNASAKWTFIPALSWSYYNGDHFGDVKWVNLKNYLRLKNNYYFNTGIKTELAIGLKSKYSPNPNLNINLDVQFRLIDYEITGDLENANQIQFNRKHKFVTPKLFIDYLFNSAFQGYTSVGFMQKEAFREDYIAFGDSIKFEQLLDFEAGIKLNYHKLSASLNVYSMFYKNQLALNGKINGVGEALRSNLDKSYRFGIELESNYYFYHGLSIWNSTNLSQNRIPLFSEYIPIYNNLTNENYKIIEHRHSLISFSPSAIITSGFNLIVLKSNQKNRQLSFDLSHTYVSDYYLDNSSNKAGLLRGYQVFDLKCSYTSGILRTSKLKLWIALYNIFNNKYNSHGWISRFYSDGPVTLNESFYLEKENANYYHYKGLYPQALRHFSMGLNVSFF